MNLGRNSGPRVPDPCPHTYGVRVCSCDAFATEPCRPAACPPPLPNHSLFTDHCSLEKTPASAGAFYAVNTGY